MKYYLVKIKVHRELPSVERLFKARNAADALSQATKYIGEHNFEGAKVKQIYEKIWDIDPMWNALL